MHSTYNKPRLTHLPNSLRRQLNEHTYGKYIFLSASSNQSIPNASWTRVNWTALTDNKSPVTVGNGVGTNDVLTFPVDLEDHESDASGLWNISAQVAWDNTAAHLSGTHNRGIRLCQRVPSGAFPTLVFVASTNTVQYDATAAAMTNTITNADGNTYVGQTSPDRHYQHAYLQAGVDPDGGDSELWIEVYQDSGQALDIVQDGIDAPLLMLDWHCNWNPEYPVVR